MGVSPLEIEKIFISLKKKIPPKLKNSITQVQNANNKILQIEKNSKLPLKQNTTKEIKNNQENIRVEDQGTDCFQKNESLKDGIFDEEKSHQYFLEALLEFRAGNKKVNLKVEENHHKEKEKPKNSNDKTNTPFFYSLGTDWHNSSVNEIQPEQKEKSIGSNQPLKINKNIIACWECLSYFDKKLEISFNFKVYCEIYYLSIYFVVLLL